MLGNVPSCSTGKMGTLSIKSDHKCLKRLKQDLLGYIHKKAHSAFLSVPGRSFARPVVQLLSISLRTS